MISAPQSHMEISGNIFNGNAISVADMLLILSAYGVQPASLSVIPKEMKVQMMMLGAIFASTDKIT